MGLKNEIFIKCQSFTETGFPDIILRGRSVLNPAESGVMTDTQISHR